MNAPHDLGGTSGHGPIDVDAPPFREEWERRQWALSKNIPLPGGTIDWWRHGIENMDPEAYATLPYFVKWCLNEMAHRVDQGLFTLEEAVSGKASVPAPPAPALSPKDVLEKQRAMNVDYHREMDNPPLFALGKTVRTITDPGIGHTRLPAYARGRTGTVIAQHGGHLYADQGARGVHEAQHLYTVEFKARELWGEAASANDTVCIDLWEPYLETL